MENYDDKNPRQQLLKQKATQSNTLVRSKYSYTLRELKLSRFIISEINPDDQPRDIIKVSKEKLYEYFKPTNKKYGAMHQHLKKIIKGLNQKPIEIISEKQKAVIYWIASHGVDKETGIYWFEIPKSMQPLLFAMKGSFSSIPLHIYDQFRSPYPARMYEILYSYRNMKGRTIKYADWTKLQDQLGGDHKEYSNFKHRILLKCYEKLKERTDLRFEYEEIKKQGTRKVEGLILTVFYNKKPKNPETEEETITLFSMADATYDQDTENIRAIEKTLLGWGISPEIIQDCIFDPFLFIKDSNKKEKALKDFKSNKIDYIWDKLEYTANAENVKDEASFFLSAIKNNYLSNKKNATNKKIKINKEKAELKQKKIELEEQIADLSKRYYSLFFSIMEELFKDEEYLDSTVKKVRLLSHNGYKSELSLKENLKRDMFRYRVLGQVKKDNPTQFEPLEKEFNAKMDDLKEQIERLTLKV